MALFQLKWLRRLMRRYTNPMAVDKAASWKQRLSLMYMLVAWNAFGFVCYMIFTGKSDWAKYHGLKNEEDANKTPALQWIQTLGIEKAKVYRFSGLRKQQEYVIEDGEIVREKKEEEL